MFAKLIETFTVDVPDEQPKHETTGSAAQEHRSDTTPAPAPHVSLSPPPAVTATVPPTQAVSDDDVVYHDLVGKTDFEATPVAAIIRKYLESLADVPVDQHTKFVTAITQAKKLDGLTDEKILQAFEALRGILRAEEGKFSDQAARFIATEITAREKRQTEITEAIAELQREQTDLAGKLADAQATANRAQLRFTAALQRRSSEIEQQATQYATFLKG